MKSHLTWVGDFHRPSSNFGGSSGSLGILNLSIKLAVRLDY